MEPWKSLTKRADSLIKCTDPKYPDPDLYQNGTDPEHCCGVLYFITGSPHVLYFCKAYCQLSNLFLFLSLQLGKLPFISAFIGFTRLGDETAVLSCSNRILIQKLRDFTHAETVLGDQVTTVFSLFCRVPIRNFICEGGGGLGSGVTGNS